MTNEYLWSHRRGDGRSVRSRYRGGVRSDEGVAAMSSVPTCWMQEVPVPSVEELAEWRDFHPKQMGKRDAGRVDDDLDSGAKGEAVFESWLRENVPREHWERTGSYDEDFIIYGVRVNVKTRDWERHREDYGRLYDSVPAGRNGKLKADLYVVVWLHEDGETATIAGGVHAYDLLGAPLDVEGLCDGDKDAMKVLQEVHPLLHSNTDAPGTREVAGDSVLLKPIDFSVPAHLKVPRSPESLSG